MLVEALRQDAPHHNMALAEVEGAFNQMSIIGWQPQFGAAVIRVATNSRTFHNPSTLEDCRRFLASFEEEPAVEEIGWGPGFWDSFWDLLESSGVRGGRVADAYLAAIVKHHNATLITLDKGFAAFPNLKWKNLLA